MIKTITVVAISLSILGAASIANAGPGGKRGKYFERADINADGKISIQEASDIRAQRFTRMDKNGDGSISPEEFVFRKKANPKREERRQKRFNRFDADQNGLISQAEWNSKVEKKFAKMDINADGFITKEEWASHRQNRKKHRNAK